MIKLEDLISHILESDFRFKYSIMLVKALVSIDQDHYGFAYICFDNPDVIDKCIRQIEHVTMAVYGKPCKVIVYKRI